MRNFLILLVVFLFVVNIFGQTKYKTYSNPRFGYSISYPSNLLAPQAEDASNSGKIFLSKDKSVEMRVYGEYDALETGLNGRYESDLKSYGESVSYKFLTKDGFTISSIKDDKILYQKTLRRHVKEIDVFYTFTIEYDKSERKKFDSIIPQIVKSFKFDPKTDV